jgi:SAM-dependent methyltransferase
VLRRLIGAVRHRRLLVGEWLFDTRRRVSTRGVVDLARGEATPYQPVHPDALREFLDHLPADRSGMTFVDVGSGRGRAVLLAAEAGFGAAVGVEIEPSHHAQALENLRRYRGPRTVRERIRLVHGDARELDVPAGPVVLFLYNPFGADLLRAVLDRVREALRASPRPAWVIYEAPVHRELLDADPAFALVAERAEREGASARRPRFAIYRGVL